MAHVCTKESLPYIIGGDFNIMRRPQDKSKDNFEAKWPDLFNMVIQTLDLREIEMSGHQYTWASSGDDPTFEKLDRVLVSTEWEQKFPLTTVHTKAEPFGPSRAGPFSFQPNTNADHVFLFPFNPN